jgi:predicted membrane channel-forming protein YqfA (hemolysin III family)
MPLDYSFVALGVVALVAVLGMAYYASRILLQMRTGELEKTWRYLVAGAYLIAAAVTILLVQEVVTLSSLISSIATHLGVTMLVIGSLYILFGFRAHYRVFSPKHPNVKMDELIER